MSVDQLIFVYNADSGLFSSLTDFAHKIISPSTYNCSLCALTYGNVSMKQEWKDFIKSLPVKTLFLHRDEFLKTYHQDADLPAVFYKQGAAIKLFIGNRSIDQCQSIQSLMELVSSELSKYDKHHHSNI